MNTNRNQQIISGIATVALSGLVWASAPTQATAQTTSKTTKKTAHALGFKTKRVNPTGKRVTMELQNASVRQALLQLFRKSGADFTLDNAVKGNVTLKITNEPFDRALALIVRSSSSPLTVDIDSGTYIIKPAGIVTSVKPTNRVAQVASADPTQATDATDPNQANEGSEYLGSNSYFTPDSYGQVGNTVFAPASSSGYGYTYGNTTFAPSYGYPDYSGFGGYNGFGTVYGGGGLIPTQSGYVFPGPGFYNTNSGVGFIAGPGGGFFSSGFGNTQLGF